MGGRWESSCLWTPRLVVQLPVHLISVHMSKCPQAKQWTPNLWCLKCSCLFSQISPKALLSLLLLNINVKNLQAEGLCLHLNLPFNPFLNLTVQHGRKTQAKPYYRSLKEHCWVSRERGNREKGGGDHTGQNLTLTMCTEMKSLKLNPHIPLALWQAWEMLLRCTWHSILPYPSLRWWWTSAVYPHFRIRLYARLSSSCIFLDHPPNSNRELAQSKFSLSLSAKDSTLGSGKGSNHMLAHSLAPVPQTHCGRGKGNSTTHTHTHTN